MAIVVKEIKPKKLNDAAMKKVLIAGMRDVSKDMEKEFKKTTRTWKHKVKFERLEEISPDLGKVEVAVLTDDEIYGYVDQGTEPHIIAPKKAGGRLSFKWAGPGSYKAKTSPRVIGSTSGGASGNRVSLPYVFHPGTEAREFDVTIAEYMQPRFKRRMEAAMKEAARVSGHKA